MKHYTTTCSLINKQIQEDLYKNEAHYALTGEQSDHYYKFPPRPTLILYSDSSSLISHIKKLLAHCHNIIRRRSVI